MKPKFDRIHYAKRSHIIFNYKSNSWNHYKTPTDRISNILLLIRSPLWFCSRINYFCPVAVIIATALATIDPGCSAESWTSPLPSITTGLSLMNSCRFWMPMLSVAWAWKKRLSPISAILVLPIRLTFGASVSAVTVRLNCWVTLAPASSVIVRVMG